MMRQALRQRFMDTGTDAPMDNASLMREAMKAQAPAGMARGAPERLGPVKRMINEAIIGRVVEPLVRQAEAAKKQRADKKDQLQMRLDQAISNRQRTQRDILRTQNEQKRADTANRIFAVGKLATDFYAQMQASKDPTDPIQQEIDSLLADDEFDTGDLLSFGEDTRLGEGEFVSAGQVKNQLDMLHDLYARYGVYKNVGPGPEGFMGALGERAPADVYNPAAIGDY